MRSALSRSRKAAHRRMRMNRYDHLGRRVQKIAADGTHTFLYDAYGNVMGYWDESGAVVAEYVYDAFGRTVAKNGTMADVFSIRYSTKCYDAETGMYYYGRRFYLLALCRWLTRDPIEEEGGVNLYGFCGNNGVGIFDAMGLTK